MRINNVHLYSTPLQKLLIQNNHNYRPNNVTRFKASYKAKNEHYADR